MSKTKYIVGAAILMALGATPFVVSQKVNALIEATSASLEQHGIQHITLSKEGYFSTRQTFAVDIVDAQKAFHLLSTKIGEKNAHYKPLIESIEQEVHQDLTLLNGLGLKGELTYSNLLPRSADVSLCFNTLPPALKEYARVVPFFEKGIVCFDMRVGSDQTLKEIKLRDFSGRAKLGGEVSDIDDKEKELLLDLDMKGHKLSLNSEKETLQGILSIAEQSIKSAGDAPVGIDSVLNDFVYRFDYKDDFNNKGDLTLGSYALSLRDGENDFNMTLGKVIANNSVETLQKELSAKANYRFDGITVMDGWNSAKVEQLGLTLFLRGLEVATVKKLQTDYNAFVLGTEVITDQMLVDDFLALIHHGLKLDMGMKVKGLQFDMLSLKDSGMDVSFEIAKNTFSDQQNPLALIGLLDVNAKVRMHKNDRALFEALGITAAEDFALGKAEEDFFVYDISMKKGVISVNGKVIQ